MRDRLASTVVALSAAATLCAALAAQVPTFRAGVDLVAVDVQVVNRDGEPIADLTAGKFSVSIDGRDRRIVTVDHVRHSSELVSRAEIPPIVTGPAARNDWPPTGPVTRTFIIAFDVPSFSMAEARRAAEAAEAFVDRLLPNDVAGLFSYPFGPRVAPTADRNAIRSALRTVMGGAKSMTSNFHLSPAEIVDISAEIAGIGQAPNFGRAAQRGLTLDQAVNGAPTGTLRRVLLRECGSENDTPCAQSIEADINHLAMYYENEVAREIGGLTDMMQVVGKMPGRKTVVVVSGGMPAADRPGGRPNVSDLARALGEEAARSNTTIYTLFLDSTASQSIAAETAKADRHPAFRARESEVMGRFLAQFASTSGGTMMQIVVGAGETALARILRETSAYYLLGVEPAKSDRDGKTHRLRVKVDAKGSTVRSRTYVQIPAASAGR
jgi:VWFA-related protein